MQLRKLLAGPREQTRTAKETDGGHGGFGYRRTARNKFTGTKPKTVQKTPGEPEDTHTQDKTNQVQFDSNFTPALCAGQIESQFEFQMIAGARNKYQNRIEYTV